MPTAIDPPLLTTEEYEKLRQYLKQINQKAQRLQASTAIEMGLRHLQWRFGSITDLVSNLQKQVTNDRSSLDREWTSCKRIDLPPVRAYLLPENAAAQPIEAVAQSELRAMMATHAKLDPEINGGNWGNALQHCRNFQDEIDYAIQACRQVTVAELQLIFTLTANFANL